MKKTKIRNVKKTVISILVLVLLIGLAICSASFNWGNEDLKMEKTVNTLLNAIQQNDSDAVIQLFSEAVREEIGDEKLEKGVEYLHSFFEGEIISIETNAKKIGENNYDGKRQRILSPNYEITTTTDNYIMWLVFYTKDNSTPSYTGLFNIEIYKESSRPYVFLRKSFMGIYVPRTIDESEKDKPQEFNTNFGSFTVSSGFYKDDSISTDDKYYFTVEDVVLIDVIYNHFSVTFARSDYDINEIRSFQDHVLEELKNGLDRIGDPYGEYYPSVGNEYQIMEHPVAETAQGYPLLKFSIMKGNIPVEKHYYIMGDRKYVLVQYVYTTGIYKSERTDEEEAMTTAVESLVDSFVWAN